MHVLRDAGGGVESDAHPDLIDVRGGDAVLLEEGAGGVCAVYFKALCRAAEGWHETDVVKHGTCVKQFAIEREVALLTSESGEGVDAAGVVEEEFGLGVADELGDLL